MIPWDDESYFICQDDEGFYESLATSNLVRDINPAYGVIINCGIGRGSCQWATPYQTTKHFSGMNDPDKLVSRDVSLKKTVLAEFQDPRYISGLDRHAKLFAQPVIALKSGCLLLLESNEELRKLVVGESHSDHRMVDGDGRRPGGKSSIDRRDNLLDDYRAGSSPHAKEHRHDDGREYRGTYRYRKGRRRSADETFSPGDRHWNKDGRSYPADEMYDGGAPRLLRSASRDLETRKDQRSERSPRQDHR